MRAATRLAAAGSGWRAVSRKAESGLVLERAISDEANIIGLTKVGLGLEQARAMVPRHLAGQV